MSKTEDKLINRIMWYRSQCNGLRTQLKEANDKIEYYKRKTKLLRKELFNLFLKEHYGE